MIWGLGEVIVEQVPTAIQNVKNEKKNGIERFMYAQM